MAASLKSEGMGKFSSKKPALAVSHFLEKLPRSSRNSGSQRESQGVRRKVTKGPTAT